MPSDTDLAWAAGFIDGEGCLSAGINNKGSVTTVISIGQKYREPLDTLQEMFSGTICQVHNKDRAAFILTISRRTEILAALDQFGPYLRVKADQAVTLHQIVSHLLEHGGRGRYSTIDKAWCQVKIKMLRSQKRIEKF